MQQALSCRNCCNSLDCELDEPLCLGPTCLTLGLLQHGIDQPQNGSPFPIEITDDVSSQAVRGLSVCDVQEQVDAAGYRADFIVNGRRMREEGEARAVRALAYGFNAPQWAIRLQGGGHWAILMRH